MSTMKRRLKKIFRMSPPLMVTEDTPPDMLAGAMDLRLVLPNGSRVKMSVDRRTPMMDLLVQVTTAYKISPAGNVLQPYGESGLLPYKPSTPIGALDTWTVHIVPKHQALQNPANKISLKQVIQPFEQTFRFQVNLPRNQLYVTRVNGRTTMSEILEQACKEKGLDVTKYTLKHPKQPDGLSLCEELSVAEYGHNQVSMVSNKTLPSSVSSEDILAMHKYSNSNKSCESSSRSLSPDSSVSPRQPVQPSRPLRKRRPAPKPPISTTVQHNQGPPSSLPKESSADNSQQKESSSSNGQVICHSRTSSDSSGYHEASVLSESPDSNNRYSNVISSLPDSLPRRSKLPSNQESASNSGTKSKLSRSLSNLHQASTSATTATANGSLLPSSSSMMKPAQSTSSLAPSRKKKPAPPPPVFSIAEEREETSSTASRTSKTLPAGARLQECCQSGQQDVIDNIPLSAASSSTSSPPSPPPPSPPVELPVEPSQPQSVPPAPSRFPDCVANVASPKEESRAAVDSSDTSSIVTPSETDRIEAEIERMFDQATREHVSLESGVDLGESPDRLPSPPSQVVKSEGDAGDPFMDWEYKLPAPPTFRDETNSPPLTEYSTMTGGKIKDVLYETTNNNREVISSTGNTALIDELSTAIVERKVLRSQQSQSQCCLEEVNNSSNLENFHITTYGGQGKRSVARMYSEEQIKSSQIGNSNITISSENKSNLIEEKTEMSINKPSKIVDSNIKTVEKEITINDNAGNSDGTQVVKANGVINLFDKEISNKDRHLSPVVRTSSFVIDKKGSPQVKRSVSYVSCLTKARMNLSKSNSDLLMETTEEDNQLTSRDQQIRLHLRPVAKSNLRKTNSELSINTDANENSNFLDKQESGLQSLQVLRSILPQISQSQGAMNTVGKNNCNEITIKEESINNFVRPTISVSTWGERPKRQVSIKSDRDYVFGQKVVLKPVSQVVKTSAPPPPQPKPPLSLDKRNKPSVYKTLETGNTKPIKLQQEQLPSTSSTGMTSASSVPSQIATTTSVNTSNAVLHQQQSLHQSQIKITSSPSRLPVVRSVELKKPYQLRQQEQPSPLQPRPVSCYLFGCQPTITNEPNQTSSRSTTTTTSNNIFNKSHTTSNNVSEKKFTSIVGINQTPTPPPPPPSGPAFLRQTVSSKRPPHQLPPPPLDPREELLRSIRSFGGRDSLRKVSTR